MSKNFLEMITHVPLCTHEEVKTIYTDLDIDNELKKYQIDIKKSDKLENVDVVIANDVFYLDAFNALTDKGIFVTKIDSLEDRELFEKYSKIFKIVMPYYYCDEDGKRQNLIFASKYYHPTADIIRHRSDFLEPMEYYNTDIHLASFTLPTKIFKSIYDVLGL